MALSMVWSVLFYLKVTFSFITLCILIFNLIFQSTVSLCTNVSVFFVGVLFHLSFTSS